MKINKKNIASIIFDLLIVSLFLLLGISMYYNNVLQNQIEERDRIINKLSINNNNLRERILNKYFNIQYDSISSIEIYTLKDEYVTTEYLNNIIKLDSIEYTHLIKDYNKLVNEYNTLVNKYNIIIGKNDSVCSTIKNQNIALELIRKNFDITYTVEVSENKTRVSLSSEKADSAFLLLPHFKTRLQYDSLKQCWNIKVK